MCTTHLYTYIHRYIYMSVICICMYQSIASERSVVSLSLHRDSYIPKFEFMSLRVTLNENLNP